VHVLGDGLDQQERAPVQGGPRSGDEVEVMILESTGAAGRISLGMKQCMPNPWERVSMNFKKSDK